MGCDFDATSVATLLQAWFAANARDLPWRNVNDPYKTWVSEIMLQQTTSEACIKYFVRFVERFPTIDSLADAPEDDVLKMWEGLGYYSRARNLQKAARIIASQYGGKLPYDPSQLIKLPGIGPYTAGAILSIAYNQPAAMVDANIRRVIGRLLAIEPSTEDAERQVSEASLLISEAGEPRVVNQAMMELGAIICQPVRPQCSICPLKQHCRAFDSGRLEFYGSVVKQRKAIPVTERCIVAEFQGWYLVGKPKDGRWKGLWEFPRFNAEEGSVSNDHKEIYAAFRNVFLESDVLSLYLAGVIKHTVTQYSITLQVYHLKLSTRPITDDAELRLVDSAELRTIALPSPMRRIANSILKDAASGQESLAL